MAKAKKKKRKPISQKQHLANQQNAKKSTGAQTRTGKETSAQNATRHGGYSKKKMLMSWEDPAEFDVFYESQWRFYDPQDPYEEMQVDEFIWAIWKIRRLRVYEAMVAEQLTDAVTLANEIRKLSQVHQRLVKLRDTALQQIDIYRGNDPISPKSSPSLQQRIREACTPPSETDALYQALLLDYKRKSPPK